MFPVVNALYILENSASLPQYTQKEMTELIAYLSPPFSPMNFVLLISKVTTVGVSSMILALLNMLQ